MKCSKLRHLLADEGLAALAGNREAEDHLVDCAGCYAVLEAMTEIDALLPELESHNVADEVVEQLLARTELSEPSVGVASATVGPMAKLWGHLTALSTILAQLEPAKRLGSAFDRARQARLRWGIVAVPAVLLVGVVSVLTMRSMMLSDELFAPSVVKQVKSKDMSVAVDDLTSREEPEETEPYSGLSAGSGAAVNGGEAGGDGAAEPQQVKMSNQISLDPLPRPAAKRMPIPPPVVVETEVTDEEIEQAMERSFEGDVTVTGSLIPRADLTVLSPVDIAQAPPQKEIGQKAQRLNDFKENDVLTRSESAAKNEDKLRTLGDDVWDSPNKPAGAEEVAGRRREESRLQAEQLEKNESEFKRDSNNHRQKISETEEIETEGGKTFADADLRSSISELVDEVDDDALSAARRFLDDRNRVEGLSFREARGYWANTYVPGDRTLRQLKARLDRTAGNGAFGSLHEGARQISQPFDSPDGAALAVYLHGDRLGVETRERMLVQIGLEGTERRSGMRPAMNVGLVLDLRGEVTPDAATSIRALLQAFASSAELGDRFSLTVAGRPGGTVVQPGDLRHGTLSVAMAELFGDGSPGVALSLDQAVAAAQDVVRADDDPNAPLGSSALIVITSQPFDALTGRLTDMAHASAVDGVPWSAIGIGSSVDLAELDSLVLAGQGNRRLLTTPATPKHFLRRVCG